MVLKYSVTGEAGPQAKLLHCSPLLSHKVEFSFTSFTAASSQFAFIFLSSTDLDKAIYAFIASHCSVSIPIPAFPFKVTFSSTAHLGCSS